MLRLLVIGCGDVARRTLPLLAQRYRIYALVRSLDSSLAAEFAAMQITPILGDLDQPASLRRLAGLADLLLHFAPPPEFGNQDPRTKHLIAALQRGKILPRRMVYISTSGVYGDCRGAWVRETRKVAPASSRSQRRIDAEQQLRRWGKRSGICISILRVPGIYAAERLPLARIRRGDPVLCEEDDVFTNHIHVDDLARCTIAALRHGQPNRIYHASDDSSSPGLRMAEWYDAIADTFALPRPPRVSRTQAQAVLTPMVLSFMGESRRLDNSRLKTELRVRLSYPDVHAGLANTVALKEKP
ncbi:MAG: SDR family oxidoreductase [Betaproteobacteria bacterium]|nr:SDR family oxidoreductase [Betaproteobacteria bacterium]